MYNMNHIYHCYKHTHPEPQLLGSQACFTRCSSLSPPHSFCMQLTCSTLSSRHYLHPARLQYWWRKHYWGWANLLTRDRTSELFVTSVTYGARAHHPATSAIGATTQWFLSIKTEAAAINKKSPFEICKGCLDLKLYFISTQQSEQQTTWMFKSQKQQSVL